MSIRLKTALLVLTAVIIVAIVFIANQQIKTDKSLASKKLISDSINNIEKSIIITDLPKTQVSYDTNTHDFGDIKEGTLLKHTYYLMNVGNEPLIIKQARTTCGCTVAQIPKKPVPPSGSAEIQIQFNTENRYGRNNKQIRVYSNATSGVITLTFTANVMDI